MQVAQSCTWMLSFDAAFRVPKNTAATNGISAFVFNLKIGNMNQREIEIQRQYYALTAGKYNALHCQPNDEHYFALSFLLAASGFYDFKSILDVGSGTGRALLYIRKNRPDILVKGIEPVKELREVAYDMGLKRDEILDGDATSMPFPDGEFDIVAEFGMLHHVRSPEIVVAEMLRVAKRAIFISDSNNFGQGSFPVRMVKQLLNSLRLWKFAYLVRTRGKGYAISEEDGLAYSYSVFNNYRQIKAQCESIHLLNTKDGSMNAYRSASHVALLGIKKP